MPATPCEEIKNYGLHCETDSTVAADRVKYFPRGENELETSVLYDADESGNSSSVFIAKTESEECSPPNEDDLEYGDSLSGVLIDSEQWNENGATSQQEGDPAERGSIRSLRSQDCRTEFDEIDVRRLKLMLFNWLEILVLYGIRSESFCI